jgi:hypothetical protein
MESAGLTPPFFVRGPGAGQGNVGSSVTGGSECFRLAADLEKPFGADHLAETFRREPNLLLGDVSGECLLGLARERGDFFRIGVIPARGPEKTFAQSVELVMGAIARLEERNVGRPETP